MNGLNTRIKSFYFSCPKCGNKGKATEVHYVGGSNDYGGFILKCKKCDCEFFLQIQNPSNGTESNVYGDFEIVEILDFEFEDDKKKAERLEKASNIVVIEGEDELTFLRDAWKAKASFNVNEVDKIFICQNCKVNIEDLIFANIKENLSAINKIYKDCFNLYVKGGYCNPWYIVFQSQAICHSCKNKIEYIAYSEFNGRGEEYKADEFLTGDIKEFNPEINGVYSRKETKRILEKFILRWNLLASQIFIVSPFIGLDKYFEQKRDKGNRFRELLGWLLTILNKSKTKLVIRKNEYKKIKEFLFLDKEIFDALNRYDLINPLIKETNDISSGFHAKFYAGIIPKADKCIVEILAGSFNIHDDSQTKENLIFTTLDFPNFNKRYLQPLKIETKCESLAHFEVLKIVNNSPRLLKIKTIEDFWRC